MERALPHSFVWHVGAAVATGQLIAKSLVQWNAASSTNGDRRSVGHAELFVFSIESQFFFWRAAPWLWMGAGVCTGRPGLVSPCLCACCRICQTRINSQRSNTRIGGKAIEVALG